MEEEEGEEPNTMTQPITGQAEEKLFIYIYIYKSIIQADNYYKSI
jgi:hypothetical protein